MSARPALSHAQALAEVYRLTPQLREYDEFMYLGVRWLPYTMFFHHRNYRSAVINTDDLGFRYSSGPAGRVSVAEFPEDRVVNLVVGGSTAMGTGTTGDAFTVASCLAALSGEVWLNFGARGYNAVQEVILFLMHRHRFARLGKVVLLSGANTLTLEGLPDDLATEHGRYYYSYEFTHYMEAYNRDLKRRSNSYASGAEGKGFLKRAGEGIRRRLKEAFADENPADRVIKDEHTDLQERIRRAAWTTVNAVAQWQLLLAPFGAELVYALQPVSRWTKPAFHAEEEAMFHAIDCCANNFWRLFGKLVAPDVHRPYREAIARDCARLGVRFMDVNALLGASPVAAENIFVDHLHFNDLGYGEVARLIHEKAFAATPTHAMEPS